MCLLHMISVGMVSSPLPFYPIVITLVMQTYLAPHRLCFLILAGKIGFFRLIRP